VTCGWGDDVLEGGKAVEEGLIVVVERVYGGGGGGGRGGGGRVGQRRPGPSPRRCGL
jgi:hypothetical protein